LDQSVCGFVEERMTRLKIRFLLAATLAVSSGGLFLAAYGANYPGTRFDYGKANQFATTPLCGGPFGPNSTYCVTIIKPVPLGQ
jgi:hypothetical protein